MTRRISSLEERVENLECQYEEFDAKLKEQYITLILNKYTPLINSLCNNSYGRLKLNFIDQEDLKQEFLEYLLRWTYREAKRRVLNGSTEIWVPFIKRSFRNFIINFQISYKKGGKRRPLVNLSSLSDINNSFLEEKFGFQSNDLHDEFELKEYITNFYYKIENTLDKEVFKLLFNPSEVFRNFISENFKNLSLFEIMATYLRSSYSSVLQSYKRLRKEFICGLSY